MKIRTKFDPHIRARTAPKHPKNRRTIAIRTLPRDPRGRWAKNKMENHSIGSPADKAASPVPTARDRSEPALPESGATSSNELTGARRTYEGPIKLRDPAGNLRFRAGFGTKAEPNQTKKHPARYPRTGTQRFWADFGVFRRSETFKM